MSTIFLTECPVYFNLRTLYVKRYYRVNPSMFKLVELFSTDNKRDIQNLATYVYKAFDERNKTLYVQNIAAIYICGKRNGSVCAHSPHKNNT